jgi:hypothetical protein
MATVAAQPEHDRWTLRNLPAPELFPTDTRSIVGSVLLAVAFSANMQITERLDTATVGGIIPWLGVLFAGMWFTTACIYFGLTGGLIVATFNPIIAVLTATGPLAPVHFTINWSYNIPFALMAYQYLRHNRVLPFRWYFVMCLIGLIFIATSLIPVWLFLFKFDAVKTAGLWIWAVALVVPHSLLGWYFLRAVTRSGTLAR